MQRTARVRRGDTQKHVQGYLETVVRQSCLSEVRSRPLNYLLGLHPTHPGKYIPTRIGWRLAVSSLYACHLINQVPTCLQTMSQGTLSGSRVSHLDASHISNLVHAG